jgi:transcriptional regulator with XRE-family HTH domain
LTHPPTCVKTYCMSEQSAPTPHLEWDLADRLRKSLRGSGVGVATMAAELDVTRQTVGNYINGHTTPPPSSVMVWALRTGYPYEWLRDGTEPQDGPNDDGSAVHVTSGNDVLNAKRNGEVIEVNFGTGTGAAVEEDEADEAA